jgi:arylsulfatase A-like enzyme
LGNQPQKQTHDFLYWEFYEQGFKQAVRQGEWKAIRFYKEGRPVRTELYHLVNDIGEKNDVSQKNPEKVNALEALMDKAHKSPESPLFRVK